MDLIQFLYGLVSGTVGGGVVSVVNAWLGRRHEAHQAERNRAFHYERAITEKSIDALDKCYKVIGNLVAEFAIVEKSQWKDISRFKTACHALAEEGKGVYLYLPEPLQDHVKGVFAHFVDILRKLEATPDDVKLKALQDSLACMNELNTRFNNFMRKYNVLNKAG
ncbi:MAG TPA: hypothetical protein VMY05_08955 [Acidobacteriota bacterium]|nr:hypothetical protein [Acidobacteriota bacterium]